MVDDIDTILRKKALEFAKTSPQPQVAKPQMSEEEVVKLIREITKGDRASEIIEIALELYKPHVIALFRKIVELHRGGVLKELQDYELYQLLQRAGFRIPLKTQIKIVRHGREFRVGEI